MENRVTKEQIKRLYEDQVKGIYDEVLINAIISRFRCISLQMREKKDQGLVSIIEKFDLAKSLQEKMIIIDSIIHLAHSSGFFAQHLIDHTPGNKVEIMEFLDDLAGYRTEKYKELFDYIEAQSIVSVVSSYKIYSTIDLPGFSALNQRSVRNTSDRFAAMGISEELIRGKTVLDIGCNLGHILFKTFEHGAVMNFGLDSSAVAINILQKIISVYGIPCMKAKQFNVSNITPDTLSRVTEYSSSFKVVFCLGVDGYVSNPENFYINIAKITGERLYFEPNNSKFVSQIPKIFSGLGFNTIKKVKVPYCTDEKSFRDCFICEK